MCAHLTESITQDDLHQWRTLVHVRFLLRNYARLVVVHLYHSSGFKFSQLEMSEFTFTHSTRTAERLYFSPEVVLVMLVSAFKFELSETPIFWNFAGIAYPTTTKGNMRPEMYLKVSMASA